MSTESVNPDPARLDRSTADDLHDHFLFLYAVALVDLHLDPMELEVLYEVGTRRGVPKERIDQTLLSPHAKRPAIPEDILDRVECLYDFALIVQADEVVEDEERAMLERLCTVFGFEAHNAHGIAEFLLERASSGVSVKDVRSEVSDTL